MIIRRRKCIVFAFVSLSRIRGQGACVLIKETATGDILSAVIVSVCHRAESDMWTIHHRRKLHFFSLSQVSAIRGEWRKMTARWSLSTIYHKAIPLYVEPSNAASAFASSLFYRELSSIINQIGLTLWFVSKIVAVSYKQQWIVILKRHQLK